MKELAEEAVSKRIYSYYQEGVNGGFIGSFDEWKQKYPKLVEKASEGVKLSEQKKESKAPIKYKTTWEEAQASGFRGTIAEYREKYPQIELVLPKHPSQPISEILEAEAQRVYEGLKKQNPNSSVTLESVKNMLLKEKEPYRAKKLRELAIFRVNKSLACSGAISSQEILEKMIQQEEEVIREEREERKRKNWEAYRKLLED